jgi:hypothetical protein
MIGLIILILICLFLFGGIGYRVNPTYGAPSGVGLVLVIVLIIWLLGGFPR